MGVPKKHKTKGGTRRRRLHHALAPFQPAVCSNCQAAVRPHEVCKSCGYYRGRQAYVPKVKKKKVRK